VPKSRREPDAERLQALESLEVCIGVVHGVLSVNSMTRSPGSVRIPAALRTSSHQLAVLQVAPRDIHGSRNPPRRL